MRIKWKDYLIKTPIIIGLFVAVLFLAKAFGWPALFDSHLRLDDDFQITAWLCLVLYRLLMYFVFPFAISAVEKTFIKGKYWRFVIRNFNIQFFAYSLVSGFYLLFGIDKLLGAEIFQSSDALMFLASFAFTLFLGREIDNSPNAETKNN